MKNFRDFTNDNLLMESTMERVGKWVVDNEVAIITAWRDVYRHVRNASKTFHPKHILKDGKNRTEKGDEMVVGEKFTTTDKKFYNRQLKAKLLELGYGVTNVRGVYREDKSSNDGQEESFLVVNLKNDPKFYDNMFKLSEYYNQDSFLYSAKGETTAVLVGTNNAEFPGYNEQIPQGEFTKNVQSMFMSRIGNKGFSFVSDDNPSYDDNRKTFVDRKIDRSIRECFEVFDELSVNSKYLVTCMSKEVVLEDA